MQHGKGRRQRQQQQPSKSIAYQPWFQVCHATVQLKEWPATLPCSMAAHWTLLGHAPSPVYNATTTTTNTSSSPPPTRHTHP
jgi:hypothetical protein